MWVSFEAVCVKQGKILGTNNVMLKSRHPPVLSVFYLRWEDTEPQQIAQIFTITLTDLFGYHKVNSRPSVQFELHCTNYDIFSIVQKVLKVLIYLE